MAIINPEAMYRYLFIYGCSLFFTFELSHALKDKRNVINSGRLEDQTYWSNVGKEELTSALNHIINYGVAKNTILFLGDGMSIPTLTAARIYKGQLQGQSGEEGKLVWETFPHVGLSKTYTVDRQVPDSASTATAFLTGVKTNFKTTGIDATGRYDDCSSITPASKLTTIAKWAQDADKRTGFVTSTRVTHASPAALYAHSANRNWECDANIDDQNTKLCPDFKDIARQLIEDEPGNNLNVILGGGLQNFDFNATSKPNDLVEVTWGGCLRADGRQLWKDWLDQKESQGRTRAYVSTLSELNQVNTKDTEFLLGLFANSHLPYEHVKRHLGLDKPTLAQMTRKAIEVLQEGPNGFFLFVEGGHIDRAHHDGLAHVALDETVAMDAAVEVALEMTSEDDTLIVVTADHAHTLSMGGYPERGNDILGLYEDWAAYGLPYTTLSYSNGPGFNYTIAHDEETDKPYVERWNLTGSDTANWWYHQLAAVYRGSSTHGGEDVVIYAQGPMSYLFHGLHEQNYIAHVMSYAACIGANKNHCESSATTPPGSAVLIALGLCLLTINGMSW